MKKKQIITAILLFMIGISAISFVWASVEDTCNVTVNTDKTEMDKTQKQVKITINLDSYEGDGFLGYEGKLEYDSNIFKSATVTSLSDWETASYDANTGMFLATTTTAKAGTQVAKITLDLKENITATTTQVKITGLTFSDGETQKVFSKTLDYTFPYNIQQEQPNEDSNSNQEKPNDSEQTIPTNEIANTTINVVTNQIVNEISDKEEQKNLVVQNITVEAVAGSNRDQTTASTKIPQTGSGLGWIIALGAIAVIGVAAYIRYHSIPLK